MILFVNNFFLQKNPRLFISLDSDDQPNLLRSSGNIVKIYQNCFSRFIKQFFSISVSSTSIPSLEYHDQQHSKQCTSCDALKRMLYLRDRTIMKLAEDRDMIKIKLTKAMNMNIELSRQLMKHQKMHPNEVTSSTVNPVSSSSPLRSKSPVNTQIREEVADLRRKCTELDEIYHHLKHHLFALRNVFADLGANTTNDSGSGYHMEDAEDDCSSINSSLSRASFLLQKQNGLSKNKANKAHTLENDEMEDEEEDDDVGADGNESTDTDFHPLPPTRSALKNHRAFTKKVANNYQNNNNVDSNNNTGTATATSQQHQQQPDKLQTGSSEQGQIKKKEVKGSVEIVLVDEPQLSNFDIWYNS